MKLYENTQLDEMNVASLRLYISELHQEIQRLAEVKQSKAGVFTIASPKAVRDWVKAQKKLRGEE